MTPRGGAALNWLRLTDDELAQVQLALYARIRTGAIRVAEHPDDVAIAAASEATLAALHKVNATKARPKLRDRRIP